LKIKDGQALSHFITGGQAMKHGKRPTVAQSNIISSFKLRNVHLNPKNWLVIKNLPDKLVIKHRERVTVLEIPVGRQ
jgi:hypothetical protein